MSVTMCDLDYLKMQCEIHENQLLTCQEELQKLYAKSSSLFDKVDGSAFDVLLMYYIKNELKAIKEIVKKCVDAKSETIKEIDRLLADVNNREEFGEWDNKKNSNNNKYMITVELEDGETLSVSARAYFLSTCRFVKWIGTFIEDWENEIVHISCVQDNNEELLTQTYLIEVSNIRKTMLNKFDEVY